MEQIIKINNEIQFPISIKNWSIERKNDKIIAKTTSKASKKSFYEFDFIENSTLHLYSLEIEYQHLKSGSFRS